MAGGPPSTAVVKGRSIAGTVVYSRREDVRTGPPKRPIGRGTVIGTAPPLSPYSIHAE
jgi:hypothetical protein